MHEKKGNQFDSVIYRLNTSTKNYKLNDLSHIRTQDNIQGHPYKYLNYYEHNNNLQYLQTS